MIHQTRQIVHFTGGDYGEWRVQLMNTIIGEAIAPVSHLHIRQTDASELFSHEQPQKPREIWTLNGFSSNLRYTRLLSEVPSTPSLSSGRGCLKRGGKRVRALSIHTFERSLLKFKYDLWGDTVNTASRMESHGEPGTIHCSDEVYQCLQDRFAFEPCGFKEIKGKGTMRTWYIKGEIPSSFISAELSLQQSFA